MKGLRLQDFYNFILYFSLSFNFDCFVFMIAKGYLIGFVYSKNSKWNGIKKLGSKVFKRNKYYSNFSYILSLLFEEIYLI